MLTMGKFYTLSSAFFLAVNFVFAHGEETTEFTGGINPIEYFTHGYYFYGLVLVVLGLGLLYGIYTLLMMVIGRHIKIK